MSLQHQSIGTVPNFSKYSTIHSFQTWYQQQLSQQEISPMMIDPLINKKIKDYIFKKLLGKGNFGSVYLVEDTANKCLAACKMIDKVKIKQIPKLGELINNEICVLFNCQDRNVVSYLASFEDQNYVYIVMEYCNGGDVDEYMKKKGGRLEEKEAKYFLKEIVNGFRSIRSIGAVHRDFKPENLLISNGVIKIADLGFSKILTTQEQTHTVLGTLYTMAPEVIIKKPYGPQCDIWSLGVVYYKMLFGQYPFKGQNYAEMNKSIRNNKINFHPQIPISAESKDFINGCLIIDPSKRITWDEIQSHALLCNFPNVLPKLNSADGITKTKQFYIRNCSVLRIRNPPEFPDVALGSAITEERVKDPLEKRVLENRINSYYQTLYIALRDYVAARITYGVSPILEMINSKQLKQKIPQEQHHSIGYIISRQTLREVTQLMQSLNKKQNILEFKHLAKQFFSSEECPALIDLFKNDQSTVIHYVAQFKSQMDIQDLGKLEGSYINIPEKVTQRERRYLIQYAITLFNNIDKVDKKTAVKILLLIQFLGDEVESKYKSLEAYSKFGEKDLKSIWYNIKELLTDLKKNYQ